MSESAREYGAAPQSMLRRVAEGLALDRAKREPKTKVQLALALGRAEQRIDELVLRHHSSQTEIHRAQSHLDEVENILDGSAPRLYMGSAPTRAHRLARHVADDLASAKRTSRALAQELDLIAKAINRGATLARVGPEAGYVCERGLVRCTGPTPVAAAEAFLKEDAAPAAEAKPQ